MAKIYDAAVIGAGSGGTLSINALAASGRFNLVAVADPNLTAIQRIKAVHPGVRTFSSHDQLFQACRTDVVCVSTWAPSHLEITRDALEHSLAGILVEKPLADNIQDAHVLLGLVREQGLPMAVPHGLLVAPHVLEIIDYVHSGEIGDLQLVEIQCNGWDIINAGIHWLNFVVVLTKQEPIDWVMSCCDTSTKTYRDGIQVETMAVTYVQMQSGMRVIMNTGDYVKTLILDKSTVFRLVGTRGVIEFYAWEPRYRITSPNHPTGLDVEVDPGGKSRHQLHLENLADQMDRGSPDFAIPESSLTALEICEAAYLSGAKQCLVTLPLTAFVPPPATNWNPGRPYSGQGGGRDGRKLPPLEVDPSRSRSLA